jgi:hypothetical protein
MTTPGDYYTRVTLWFERGQHNATNYARGTVLPINSQVRVLGIRGNNIQLQALELGNIPITIINVPKYTKVNAQQLAARMLSVTPLDLGSLPPELQASIKAGQLKLGMTKEQVIMTRGYPPAHATPSLELDRWTYWNSRVVKHALAFQNGVLTKGRGLG